MTHSTMTRREGKEAATYRLVLYKGLKCQAAITQKGQVMLQQHSLELMIEAGTLRHVKLDIPPAAPFRLP